MKLGPKILAFAGSTRRDSWNKKLVNQAAAFAKNEGAEVTVIDLADYPMPLYDGDLEAASGLPAKAKELKKLFIAHQGLLIASPEYNSSITAVLKNALDWVSRSEQGEPSLVAFADKVAAIISASPGALGGLRGLVHLRSILGNIRVLVLPEQIAINNAHEAFGSDGALRDAKQLETVKRISTQLVHVTRKLLQ